jgi:hypothetical protein
MTPPSIAGSYRIPPAPERVIGCDTDGRADNYRLRLPKPACLAAYQVEEVEGLAVRLDETLLPGE